MANQKLTLGQRIAAVFTGMIPTKQVTRYSFRGELPSIAQALDVDYVHSILRSAEAGNVMDLFALYRDIILDDSHLQTEFSKRKLAVIGDPLNLEPADKQNADDIFAKKVILDEIESCPSWLIACSHLLDSVLWPVAIVEKVFKPSTKPGLRYELAELVPVPERLLDYTSGHLQIRGTDPETGIPTGELNDVDLNRYIVHRGHLLTVPDNWGGPMRSLVFWWLLSSMDRDWWARFLDRYGSPFLVGKYDQDDDASRTVLERAFQFAVKLGGLVVSKQTEVDVKQAAASNSADAYEKFLTICQREKSKLIVGQTSSAEMQASGLDGGRGHKNQEQVRQDIRQFDALMLGVTLRTQLFDQFLRINGLRGRTPRPLWGAVSYDNAKILGEVLSNLRQAGLEPTDDAILVVAERLGFGVQRTALLGGTNSGLPLSAELSLLLADPSFSRRGLLVDGANQEICRRGSAALAQAFRGHLAPVRRIILESKSPEDLEQRLKLFYADWTPKRLGPVIQDALSAQAANAVQNS